MKIIVLASLLLLVGCPRKNAIKEDGIVSTDSAAVAMDTTVAATGNQDILPETDVPIDDGYVLKYPKEVLLDFEKWFKESYATYVASPDTALADLLSHGQYDYPNLKGQFTSEAGEDSFFALYAYFLKHKQGDTKYRVERENLLHIFWLINELHGSLQYGGTYFGHQHYRIYGFAEYAIYRYADNDWLVKNYSIEKQKRMFLDGLRQRILDEEEHDFETLGAAKTKRRKELLAIVDEMDKHISNFFYLRVAQEFTYTKYL